MGHVREKMTQDEDEDGDGRVVGKKQTARPPANKLCFPLLQLLTPRSLRVCTFSRLTHSHDLRQRREELPLCFRRNGLTSPPTPGPLPCENPLMPQFALLLHRIRFTFIPNHSPVVLEFVISRLTYMFLPPAASFGSWTQAAESFA